MAGKRPICGILSVALPPLGLLIGGLASLFVTDPLRGVVIAIVILSLSASVAGLICAICGLFRGERLRWLPVIGLILSACLVFSHFRL